MSPSSNDPLPRNRDALYEELRAYFLKPARPERARLLGLEFEFLRVCREGCTAAPSEGEDGPDDFVLAVGERYRRAGVDPEVIRERGGIAILRLGALNFSLEPGGQIEISLPPYETPQEVGAEIDRFVRVVHELLDGTPWRALFVGHQPVSMPADIPLRAKPRYAIMNRRLEASGSLGKHMMRATAGMQVTLDYRSEQECVSMLRAALTTAPFVTAIFANSPLVGGKPSGWLSYRERAWWDTDPSRCGVPVALLSEKAVLDDYVDFALDAEMWFVRRDGELREVEGRRSFRAVHEAGEVLTLDDFSLHASTLFPAARLRGGLEVRSADCAAPEYAPAFVTLVSSVLYDEAKRARAAQLHPFDGSDVATLHEAAARDGVLARVGDFSVREACEDFLDLASDGLDAATRKLLAPVERVVESGRPPAVATLESFARESRPC